MSRATRLIERACRALAISTLCVAALAAGPGARAQDLQGLFARYWDDEMELRPRAALSQGQEQAAAQFDESLQDSWLMRMRVHLAETATALGRVDVRELSGSDRVSYEMLRYQVSQARELYDGSLYLTARCLPVEQFQGLHGVFAHDAAGSGELPFRTVDDFERALARADAYARWTDDSIDRLREGMRRGVVLPRMVVDRLLPQLALHFGTEPEQTEFWRPIAGMPKEFPEPERERLKQEYRTKISEVIEPAYRRLHDFLRDEYRPHARASVGLSAVPGGAQLYHHYIAQHTTTRLNAKEIHALGLREVHRIQAEMARVREALGFHGTQRAFFESVRADSSQRFASEAEIQPAYDAQRLRILPLLNGLFDHLPKAAYEVRALPESARASQGNGYYAAAAADGSRPGTLWINIYAPGVRDKFNVVTISLHEGLPGHHLQTSLAQERLDLPAFRRFDETTAFVEGWGLYAESLGQEMGFYANPWANYGHLNYEMLRASRLVVDTGIHDRGWSVEHGVRFMMAHSSMTRDQATAEVERYVAYPGQALAYKVGELKIRQLRERAQRVLGPQFDLKGFHDAVLLEGSVPLEILEQNVDQWIRDEAARKRVGS